MAEFTEILNSFQPISLEQMDNVKLMDRTDTKYVFHNRLLPEILQALQHDYKVLDINGNRVSRYESLYYDTPDFELYHKHQRGKLNRYKIRFRKYVESNLHFFEVKFKNKKGRTIKTRVKQPKIENTIHTKAQDLLTTQTPFEAHTLEPKLWVNYSRITLVNNNSPERVTIDVNLQFATENQLKEIANIVIAEVKQDKASSSAFINLMKEKHIREGSISKYCYGVIHLFNHIKHNNFKPAIHLLKKKLYDTTARA